MRNGLNMTCSILYLLYSTVYSIIYRYSLYSNRLKKFWISLDLFFCRRIGTRSGPHGAAPSTTTPAAAAAASTAPSQRRCAAWRHGSAVRLQHAPFPDCVAAQLVASRAALLARRPRLQLSAAAQSWPRGSAHSTARQPLPDQHAKVSVPRMVDRYLVDRFFRLIVRLV
jgi:hypothetical protein